MTGWNTAHSNWLGIGIKYSLFLYAISSCETFKKDNLICLFFIYFTANAGF